MATHSLFGDGDNSTTPPDDGWFNPRHQTPRDIVQQLIISVLLGLGAFLSFCLLRPKWPQFYYARKIRIRNASSLPELPPSLFGWIPTLWRISDEEVLATAGLDAYVFLAFFKMAIRFLFVSSILAAVVLVPIHSYFGSGGFFQEVTSNVFGAQQTVFLGTEKKPVKPIKPDHSYLWANLVFVYIFTGLAYYFLWDQTQEVVQVRQSYLGSQSTITDRTLKISGIPEELRSEGALKEYIEKLRIGKVENITICRQWKELDRLLNERHKTLRKLEEVHTIYHSHKSLGRDLATIPSTQPELPVDIHMYHDEEIQPLLEGAPSRPKNSRRPQLTMRYGRFKLKSRKIDAIDYFTMKLQRLDDRITEARRKEYQATPLAFVTMDSVSATQVAMQTLLDPTPGALIARQAPSPPDIIWPNTYLSRKARLARVWSISIFVTLLSIFWLIPVAGLAGLWNMSEIRRVWPGLADAVEEHEILGSLVQNFLPTLVLTLLNVAVPYLYDWLSQYQGLISQEDVALSVISKNFFFTFFNLFLAFTISGTAFTFHTFWETIKGSFSDTKTIALLLAAAVEDLGPFYVNLIILQGLGMFPFRLLQIGTVTLYPVAKYGAKTPRDYAELVQPPIFRYGFYLPQPILIFIICIVYSVLQRGVLILSFGVVYFVLGYFTYKYQLLYAMDHPRHSTGKAWPMIVYRVILGLVVFQLTMTGWLALRQAYTRAGLMLPLLAFTIWTYWHYNQHYRPANYHIALKSVRGSHNGPTRDIGIRYTMDEAQEETQEFINPSLVSPLENVWVSARSNENRS